MSSLFGDTVETEALDSAISDALGLHGAWILTVEVYDPTSGEPELHTIRKTSTIWQALGMIETVRQSTFDRLRDYD